jgi:hypothetical protein
MYEIGLPALFLLVVFGAGYYQKRKKDAKKRLRIVVSNSTVNPASTETGNSFERHLQAVKSSENGK